MSSISDKEHLRRKAAQIATDGGLVSYSKKMPNQYREVFLELVKNQDIDLYNFCKENPYLGIGNFQNQDEAKKAADEFLIGIKEGENCKSTSAALKNFWNSDNAAAQNLKKQFEQKAKVPSLGESLSNVFAQITGIDPSKGLGGLLSKFGLGGDKGDKTRPKSEDKIIDELANLKTFSPFKISGMATALALSVVGIGSGPGALIAPFMMIYPAIAVWDVKSTLSKALGDKNIEGTASNPVQVGEHGKQKGPRVVGRS